MKRREFVRLAAVGSAGAIAGASVPIGRPGKAGAQGPSGGSAQATGRMVVGCQSRRGTEKADLEFLARHGVYHMDPGEPRVLEDGRWDLDDARRQVDDAAKYGISIAAYHLPLSSAGIDRQRFPNVMLGKSPARDREIEKLQQNIRVAGQAGVPLLLYNTTILPVVRSGRTVDPARGNASYSTWNYEDAVRRKLHEQPTIAGNVSIDQIYERITYLLDRLLPVAAESKVKLANHIADPPLPVGYRGITRWNSPDVFQGLQRFAQLYDSPYHGFNLCVGTTGEGLRNPREEIIPILQWLGQRKQIFNIHLRNIRGGWNSFQEVYPDNGDMDFVTMLRTLRDVGYTGMLMPDHIPSHEDPAARDQGFAFAYGHIKGMLQAMYGWDAFKVGN